MILKSKLTKTAKQLRKNMTDAENILWYALRNRGLGVKFRRQNPIGQYIVDFVSFEKKIIIEVDGGQHADDKGDVLRTEYLKVRGFKVIRFWNHDVLENRDGVLEEIVEVMKSPSLTLPASREGKCYSPPVSREGKCYSPPVSREGKC